MNRQFENSICESILCSLCNAYEYDINIDKIYKAGLKKEFFSNPAHREIFEVLYYLYKANKPYTEDIVMDNLVKMKVKNFENIWIDIISKNVLLADMVVQYVEVLKSNYHKEMIRKLCAEALHNLEDEAVNPEALSQKIKNGLDDFDFINNKSYTKSIAQIREDRKSETQTITRIATGIPFIDTVLKDKTGSCGLRNEGLYFISGLKESGKTFILTRMLENISKKHSVLFGSLEFGKELYDEDMEEAQNEGLFDGNINNIFVFDDLYDIDLMINEVRFQHKEKNIAVLAIDSMMRITNNNNPDLKTDEKKLSDVFAKLGKMSKEIKIPVIIVTQTSKEDMKASVISVKGAVNADHEAYVWFHLGKTFFKDPENEQRYVVWNKNKDTKTHPLQHLMFEPVSKDFYRIEVDKDNKPVKAIDKPRKSSKGLAIPQYKQPVVTIYENREHLDARMPEIDF